MGQNVDYVANADSVACNQCDDRVTSDGVLGLMTDSDNVTLSDIVIVNMAA